MNPGGPPTHRGIFQENFVKKFGIIFAALVGILIIVGLFLPNQYTVTRTLIIKAIPSVIHTQVNDLSKWEGWAPWLDEDPSLIIILGEKKSGVGASQTWHGKDGNGSLVFTQSSPEKGIDYDISFEDGMYKCTAFIHYRDLGGSTQVIWTMTGNMEIPVVGGYFALSMDSMAGPMFQRGLTKLMNVVDGK